MFAIRVVTFVVIFAVISAFAPVKTARFLQKSAALNANIIETAVSAGNFKTLVAAITACGLVDALSTGKFTVFAPTDEAFAKLAPGTVEALLADIPYLTKILQFHVHPGIMSPTRTGRTLDTLMIGTDNFPKQLTVKVTNWECVSFIIAGQASPAQVMAMGLKADNGLIHVINEVLLPYEGDIAPTVTFIGMGGLTMPKALQLTYYGPETGKGRDPDNIKGGEGKVYEDIKVGSTWIQAANHDNTPDYFAEEILRKG